MQQSLSCDHRDHRAGASGHHSLQYLADYDAVWFSYVNALPLLDHMFATYGQAPSDQTGQSEGIKEVGAA